MNNVVSRQPQNRFGFRLLVGCLLLTAVACNLLAPGGDTPTPDSQACQIDPDPAIVVGQANWRETFACPTSLRRDATLEWVPFEHGYAIRYPDAREIYILYDGGEFKGGTLARYEDTWQEGDPVSDPDIDPPEGFFQPQRHVGLVWRTQPDVRQRLGWATNPASEYAGWQQDFQDGALTVTAAGNGDLIALDPGDGQWARLPVEDAPDYFGGLPEVPAAGTAVLSIIGLFIVAGLVFSGRRRLE